MPQRSGAKNSEHATPHAAARASHRKPDEELLTGSLAPADKRTLSIEEEIGAQVRRFRRSMDLTVAQLGMNAGISAGMLSKIENGTISPSLSTLCALAKALNVSMSSLFAESEERRDCSFVKAGQGVRIERRGTKAGHLYDLLGHSLAGEIGVEPFLITLRPTRISATPAWNSSTCSQARFATGTRTARIFWNRATRCFSMPQRATGR